MSDSNDMLPEGFSGPKMQPGWVWLCGAGPGDPGLMTLHAVNALRQADVIVHDALVDPQVLQWARPDAARVFVGKRGGQPSPKQKDISARLVALAREGQRVLRLKGGDPFVFGRGGEEALDLVRQGIPVRILPGISAGIAGLAYAGIPVTHRDVNRAVTFVTGHGPSDSAQTPPNWKAISEASEVVVIYMGMRVIDDIAAALIAAGRPGDEPVAVVTEATTPRQQVLETTLARVAEDIGKSGMKAPAIICVGRTVLLRQALDWQAMLAGERPRSLDPLKKGGR